MSDERSVDAADEKFLKRLPAVRVPEYLYERIMARVEIEMRRLPAGFTRTDVLRNVLDAWSKDEGK